MEGAKERVNQIIESLNNNQYDSDEIRNMTRELIQIREELINEKDLLKYERLNALLDLREKEAKGEVVDYSNIEKIETTMKDIDLILDVISENLKLIDSKKDIIFSKPKDTQNDNFSHEEPIVEPVVEEPVETRQFIEESQIPTENNELTLENSLESENIDLKDAIEPPVIEETEETIGEPVLDTNVVEEPVIDEVQVPEEPISDEIEQPVIDEIQDINVDKFPTLTDDEIEFLDRKDVIIPSKKDFEVNIDYSKNTYDEDNETTGDKIYDVKDNEKDDFLDFSLPIEIEENVDEVEDEVVVDNMENLCEQIYYDIISNMETLETIKLDKTESGKLQFNNDIENYFDGEIDTTIDFAYGEFIKIDDIDEAIQKYYNKDKGKKYVVTEQNKTFNISASKIKKINKVLKTRSIIELVKNNKLSESDIKRVYGKNRNSKKVYKLGEVDTNAKAGVYIQKEEMIAVLDNVLKSQSKKLEWLKNIKDKFTKKKQLTRQ